MCEKTKKKAKSICLKENQDGKFMISKFKDNQIMNTTLKSNNYLKLLKEWEESNEKIYGMEFEDYKKILKWCEIDQIDRTKPNISQAFKDVKLINVERRNIRKKMKNKSCFDGEKKLEEKERKNLKENKISSDCRPIFERKKIVIKNSGFILKNNDYEKTKTKIEIDKSSFFIPII